MACAALIRYGQAFFRASLFSFSLLLGLAIASFILFNLFPGDTARIVLGPYASQQAVDALREQLGLNLPWLTQWWAFFSRMLQGDFGRSLINHRDVASVIWQRTPLTLTIGMLSTLISLVGSYLLNLVIYLHPTMRWFRYLVLAGVLVPSFFAALLVVMVIGQWFPGLPLSRLGNSQSQWYDVLLPAFPVALYPQALLSQLLEQRLQEQKRLLHYRAAKACGYGPVFLFHHSLLRPAALPWLTAWLHQFSTILVATLIVEVIFSLPGLGTLLIAAVQQKDFPMLQAVVILNGVFFIFFHWLQQLLSGWVDPRVRV